MSHPLGFARPRRYLGEDVRHRTIRPRARALEYVFDAGSAAAGWSVLALLYHFRTKAYDLSRIDLFCVSETGSLTGQRA